MSTERSFFLIGEALNRASNPFISILPILSGLERLPYPKDGAKGRYITEFSAD